jgi:hypothetical protein
LWCTQKSVLRLLFGEIRAAIISGGALRGYQAPLFAQHFDNNCETFRSCRGIRDELIVIISSHAQNDFGSRRSLACALFGTALNDIPRPPL